MDVDQILNKLTGTCESEIIEKMNEIYSNIDKKQETWYKTGRFLCPEGCGSCCHNFEPDLLYSEAVFMAAWLIQNQTETANQIIEGKYPFDNGKTCPFYNSENPYHCSIYNGRPLICRLFGGSCSKDKSGNSVWKPCKFYPSEKLEKMNPPVFHKQYSEEQVEKMFGTVPPVMSDFLEEAVSLNSDNLETLLIREILPDIIRKLLWLCQLNSN